MDQGRTIVVYGDDRHLAARLEVELPGASVLQPRNTSELARVLTSGLNIDLLVAYVTADRDWRVLGIVRDGLHHVDIVAVLTNGVAEHDDQGSDTMHQVRYDTDIEPVVALIVSLCDSPTPPDPAPAPVVAAPPSGANGRPIRRARTIAVLGAGGGVGTTTVAVALARELSESKDVVIVDLDPQHGAIASVLRANPTYTIDDINGVMHDPDSLDEALPMCLVPVHERLHLLAGPTWTTGRASPDRNIAVLDSLARSHDVVVLDLGARGPNDLNVVTSCTDAVVVCSHDIVVAGRLSTLGDAIDELAPGLRHWNVLNQIRNEGPSPSNLSAVLGHGWSCEVPWSRRLRKIWNDPLGGLGHGTRRPWTQVSRHLTWIINASDDLVDRSSPARTKTTVTTPSASASSEASLQPPTQADATTEEPTHV